MPKKMIRIFFKNKHYREEEYVSLIRLGDLINRMNDQCEQITIMLEDD